MVNVQVVALRELRVVVGADPVAVAHGAAVVGLHVGAVADEDDIAGIIISISFHPFLLSFYQWPGTHRVLHLSWIMSHVLNCERA